MSARFCKPRFCIVMSWKIESDLAQLKVGLIIHSKRLTFACRILRNYTSQKEPSVIGYDNCDGVIRQRFESRQMMKKFDSKHQFLC